ncbi:hypothetical protein [Salisaeta longa]|uniref:hypothetical protein n=1 Tax=Salisaeta longa TaxID=503170 RepID=UPI0003B431C9|nr:hypothetical protein [Salisaeta longa]
MQPLSLQTFTRAVDDVERTQYEILGGLQRARTAFSDRRVYPHLGRLVKLHEALTTVMERSEAYRTSATGTMTGIDWENQRLQYAWPDLDQDQMAVVTELMHWALPHLRAAIAEGTDVYEYVEDNLALETVGIVPSYVQEGYVLVRDPGAAAVHVLRYTLSLITREGERYRTLRTEHCKTIAQGTVAEHPSSIKLSLVDERKDLPNPATYLIDTEETFPYEDTVLPIVKRKLMRYLARQEGQA